MIWSTLIYLSVVGQQALPAPTVLGFIVPGTTTREQIERRLGEGEHITGGHPHAARLWRGRQSRLELRVDGFQWAEKGLYAESIDVSRSNWQTRTTPKFDERKLRGGLFGIELFDLLPTKLEQRLRQIGAHMDKKEEFYVLKGKITGSPKFSSYEVDFRIRNGVLDCLCLSVLE